MDTKAEKFCNVCGRRMEPRKKWLLSWSDVKYCSAGCRKRGLRNSDVVLEKTILRILTGRKHGATICPSEAASVVDATGTIRRADMELVRCAARRLANRGVIQVTQRGQPVDPSRAKGPIRLRLMTNG